MLHYRFPYCKPWMLHPLLFMQETLCEVKYGQRLFQIILFIDYVWKHRIPREASVG